ncbi:hypothetical protein JL720_7120 [Aureococcus anophagefferens]|nr:hypothetical protein JL720_7120 [Aureococcus anophagefferens]
MMVCHLWRAALVAAAAAYSRHDADVVYDFEGSLQGWGSAASSEMQLDVAARGGELLGTVRGGAFVSEPHLDSPPLALSAAGRQTVAIRMKYQGGAARGARLAATYGGAAPSPDHSGDHGTHDWTVRGPPVPVGNSGGASGDAVNDGDASTAADLAAGDAVAGSSLLLTKLRLYLGDVALAPDEVREYDMDGDEACDEWRSGDATTSDPASWASPFWRLRADGERVAPWIVSELVMYADRECSAGAALGAASRGRGTRAAAGEVFGRRAGDGRDAGGTFLGYAFERAVAVRCVAICQSMLAANRAESVTLERSDDGGSWTRHATLALPAAATIAKANPCKLSHTADDYDRKRREAYDRSARFPQGGHATSGSFGARDAFAIESIILAYPPLVRSVTGCVDKFWPGVEATLGAAPVLDDRDAATRLRDAYVDENGYLRRGVAVLDKMPWYNGTDRVERSAYGATFACPRNGGPTLTIRGERLGSATPVTVSVGGRACDDVTYVAAPPGYSWTARANSDEITCIEGARDRYAPATNDIFSVTLGNVTTTTIIGLDPDTRYVFAVAAVVEDRFTDPDRIDTVDLYGRRPLMDGARVGPRSTFTNATATLTTARDAFDVEGDAGRRAAPRNDPALGALNRAVAKRIALVGDFSPRTFALPLVPTAACGPAVRLTPAAPRRAGAVWYGRRLNVREGFDTTFVLRPSDPSRRCGVMDGAHTRCRSRGGDGFAFVVQTDGPAALGGEGSGLGHDGLRDAVAVEFDTYYNPELLEPYENHVAVHARGRGAPSSAHHEAALASSARLPDLGRFPAGREFRVVRVVYDPAFDAGLAQLDAFEASPAAAAFLTNGAFAAGGLPDFGAGLGTLSVFVDDLDAPVVVAPLNLDALLSLHHGRAYVGLTAATGLDTWQVHDVLQWNFTMLRKDPPIDMPPVVNGAGSTPAHTARPASTRNV